MLGKALPEDRLGARHDQRDSRADADRAENTRDDPAREERRKRVRGVVVIESQGETVDDREKGKQERDQPEGSDQPPAHVLAHDLRDEHAEHGEKGQDEGEVPHDVRGLVLGAQSAIRALPGLRNVDELPKGRDLPAGDHRFEAYGRLPHPQARRPFVHEPPVRPARPSDRGRLDGPEVGRQPPTRQEAPRDGAGLLEGRTRAWSVVSPDQLEGGEISQRGDLHPFFVFDPRLKPAHRPAPDLRLAAVVATRCREPELLFQIDLGLVFDLEAAGEPALGGVEAPARQVALRQHARLLPIDAKLDRGLGKGPIEESPGHRRAGHDGDEAQRDETAVFVVEFFHAGLMSKV